jgi:hypothetical protein
VPAGLGVWTVSDGYLTQGGASFLGWNTVLLVVAVDVVGLGPQYLRVIRVTAQPLIATQATSPPASTEHPH